MMLTTPILIVGAGPVGLQMAIDLGWRGRECLIVDQRDGMPVLNPRASGIWARTMEFLRRWNVAEDVRQAGFPHDFELNVVYCTTLSDHLIEVEYFPSIDATPANPYSPEINYRCPQTLLDPALARALASFPSVTLRHHNRLLSFEQANDHVLCHLRDLRSGEEYAVRAGYLIACDGRGSGIADAIGIGYDGKLLSYSVSAILRIPGLFSAIDLPAGVRYLFSGPEGIWANLTAIDGKEHWRFSLVGTEEKLNVDTLNIHTELRRAFGSKVVYTLLDLSPWRRAESIAERYREGRVFLVGDAAHVMSPHGGHGMNTGVGDAVDLGWKLDAVMAGWGGARLLDSYEAERRPIAIRNVGFSSGIFHDWKNPSCAASLTADGNASERFRASLGDDIKEMLKPEWHIWGVEFGYRYEGSPICVPDGTPSPPDPPDQCVPTARPGSRVPHAWLPDGRSTIDLFGKGFVLLRLQAQHISVERMVDAAHNCGVPLTLVDLELAEMRKLCGAPLVLVRPDGHACWRGNAVPKDAVALIEIVRGGPASAPASDQPE